MLLALHFKGTCVLALNLQKMAF